MQFLANAILRAIYFITAIIWDLEKVALATNRISQIFSYTVKVYRDLQGLCGGFSAISAENIL